MAAGRQAAKPTVRASIGDMTLATVLTSGPLELDLFTRDVGGQQQLVAKFENVQAVDKDGKTVVFEGTRTSP
jgi:hypothetical protein